MILPSDFTEQTKALPGMEFDSFVAALHTTAPVSLRINAAKTGTQMPFSGGKDLEPVPWCGTGYYLPSRPQFTLDPLLHAGAYYVQEASSMFVEQAVRQHVSEPSLVLDLCAAPGGKSTHLASLLPQGSFLISNEFVRSRAHILVENLNKWGYAHCAVSNNSPADWGRFPSLFDVILVDAPCSGEGLFRKTPKAVSEWSLQNVRKCTARQREILTDVWDSLKSGGLLIYSTCTYNRHENEETVQWAIEHLGAELLKIKLNDTWGVSESDFGYRFFPYRTKGEGFFLSVLRKTAAEDFAVRIPKIKTTVSNSKRKETEQFIKNENDYHPAEINGKHCFLPKKYADLILFLNEKIHLLTAGIAAGAWKGKDFIPDAGLALSTELNHCACTTAEVDTATALSFLRTENIVLPDAPRGLLLLTFRGFALGWVKNLGNRCNSLYPSQWRIRMK